MSTGRFVWGDRGMKPVEKGNWFFYRCAKCGFKVPKFDEDDKDINVLRKRSDVQMTDQEKVMSWIEGLAQDDWHQFHSDSEVSNIAKAALTLLKEQEQTINALESDLKETLQVLGEKGVYCKGDERETMNIGEALKIFMNIDSDEYTIDQKATAILKVLDMPTHNGVTKEMILTVTRWLWEYSFELADAARDVN